MIHELKIESESYQTILAGYQAFIVTEKAKKWWQKEYSVGDYLSLNEIENEKYTGRNLIVMITYIFDDKRVCKEDFVILGFGFVR